MIVKTAKLEGRALDYAVALCEGYRWAKNAVGRYGDGFRRAGEKPQYPIGSRLVVSPSRQKDLSETVPNWDGWLISDMKEPIAPAAFDDIPMFSTDWSQGGPIIERQEIELSKWGLDGWMAKDTNYQFLNTPHENGTFCEGDGPTPLIAAMRCYVASRLGDEVEIPDVLLRPR